MDDAKKCSTDDTNCGRCSKVHKLLSGKITGIVNEFPCPVRYKVFGLIHSAMDAGYQATGSTDEAVELVRIALEQLVPKYQDHEAKNQKAAAADAINRAMRRE